MLQFEGASVIKTGDPYSAANLWHALDVDGAEITSYLVSFVVIADSGSWPPRAPGHAGPQRRIGVAKLRVLLALTLMPFTSDLIGRYGSNPVAVTLFGLNLVAISLTTQWIFLHGRPTTS